MTVLVRSRDVQLVCADLGRGEPVLLIHGIGDDHRSWHRVVRGLARDHRTLAYDVRGFGASSVGDADGTLAQLGDDAIAVLDALGLERAHLVGFSMGGTIAMRAALDHHERVGALVLVATSSRVGREARDRYVELADLALRDPAAFRVRLEADVRRAYEAYPDEVGDVLRIRIGASADTRGYANAARAMASLHDAPLDAELSRIAAPTLVVAGELDPACGPRAAAILTRGIAHADLELMTGVPHGIPVLRPDALAELIRRAVVRATRIGGRAGGG